jgi:prenyltransferase beta subunit
VAQTPPADISTSLNRARDALLQLQHTDGRFQGRLSSNTYPTAACALLDFTLGKPLDDGHLQFLAAQQLPDGRFALDPSARPDDEATRLVRATLAAFADRDGHDGARAILDRTPDLGWHLWLVRLLAAVARQYDWARLPPPRSAEIAGALGGLMMPLLPSALLGRAKPPQHIAPPPSFFRQRAFRRLFIAEQYTLAPALFLIEAHTRRRPALLHSLLRWMLARQAGDGSWFCVTFITALAAMALAVAQHAVPQERVARLLRLALDWIAETRNPDGGHREAISLNVWDTALGARAFLAQAAPSPGAPALAACRWLARSQNLDGGWSFHAVRRHGLPSDADDTALATFALLRAGVHRMAAERGVRWLAARQARDGSWATYRPGAGDAACVSVTAHAAAALHAAGDAASAQRAAAWLARAQCRDGYWEDMWIARKVYGTATALAALAQLGGKPPDAIRRGSTWLRRWQNTDGGWGETQHGERAASTAEQTAFGVQALAACGQSAPEAVEWLRSNQRPDGGWDAAPIGIYWDVIGGYANPLNALVFPILALAEAART